MGATVSLYRAKKSQVLPLKQRPLETSFRNVSGHVKAIPFTRLPPVRATEAGAGSKEKRKHLFGIFHLNIFQKYTLGYAGGTMVTDVVPALRDIII